MLNSIKCLKNRWSDFSTDKFQWISCLFNIILCGCMAYFYISTESYATLLYSIFFAAYIVLVFFIGEKVIPILYLIYVLCSTQNITFINETGFFILIFLSWIFEKQKLFMFGIYIIDIFLVCFRHEKSIWYLLCHFAFCLVFYLFSEYIRKKIEQSAVEKFKANELESIKQKLESDFRNKLELEIREKIEQEKADLEKQKLNLTDSEIYILTEITSGKLQKEIEGFSENTICTKLKMASARNNCSKDELKLKFLRQYK